MELYDIVIKDKYGKGFLASIKFIDKSDEQIKEILDLYNGKTPGIPNRWRLASKQPAAHTYNKDAQPEEVGA
jgi:hypothetical protein